MKLCFLGDSLIEYYDWQARFPGHTVDNLGISGETTAELLFRIPYLDLTTEAPDCVIIMTGTNDILMNTNFLPTYEQIVISIRQLLPKTSLVACGLFPMTISWMAQGSIPQINAELKALCLRYKIGYLDGDRLIPDAMTSHLFFLEDGVHLTPHGYTVWSKAITRHLHL
ncbi:MAG: hypothetical protein KKD63_02940 [Proteobacteria bacterium]|nr:hypothetical protein [Desulfobulbaceae bacterium]MBU4151816.1 hypothetical protein [Pseudomonadota bacterium]